MTQPTATTIGRKERRQGKRGNGQDGMRVTQQPKVLSKKGQLVDV